MMTDLRRAQRQCSGVWANTPVVMTLLGRAVRKLRRSRAAKEASPRKVWYIVSCLARSLEEEVSEVQRARGSCSGRHSSASRLSRALAAT